MRPFLWFKDLLGSGDPRVHAVVVLSTSLVLCFCTVWISVTGRGNQSTELGIVVGALTTLAGYAWKVGKEAEGIKP